MEAIARGAGGGPVGTPLDLKELAALLFFSAGVTKKRQHPGGEVLFRAAACTGALYHIELYLVCAALPGLDAGVYHASMHDFALRRLRSGDHRGTLVAATAGEPRVAGAPAVLVLTTTYWRNAWKYQARAYRHAFWDSGTILANLLAVAGAAGIPARLVMGFMDRPVNDLLGLDTEKEAAVALVALGRGGPQALPPAALPPLRLDTVPLSKSEVDYPAIREAHGASSLATEAEVAPWRGAPHPGRPRLVGAPAPEPAGRLFPLEPSATALDSIERVILRRGSTRRFAREPISLAQLATALDLSTRAFDADFLGPESNTLNELYLIVHAVDGLPPGAYFYHRERRALELLMEGDLRDTGGFLGLEQELPADAAVDVFYLTDLERVLGRFGGRGYRAAQIEAGVMGGRLYLAAYAQGFGATGLTFYDDEVTDFFSPHAQGKSVMFLVALGRPARRRDR